MHPDPQTLTDAGDDDAHWADLLSPARRRLIASAGLAAGDLASASTAAAAPRGNDAVNTTEPGPGFRAIVPPAPEGRSPWGQATASEPTPRPASVRPGEATLPTRPRAYTDIKSYHAHIYFDEDSFERPRCYGAGSRAVPGGAGQLEP